MTVSPRLQEMPQQQQQAHASGGGRLKPGAFLAAAICVVSRALLTSTWGLRGQDMSKSDQLLWLHSLKVVSGTTTNGSSGNGSVKPSAYLRQVYFSTGECSLCSHSNFTALLDSGYEERIPFLSEEEKMSDRWEETDDCKYYDWQKKFYPTCNNIHDYFSRPEDLWTVAVGGESIIIGQRPLELQQVFLKAGRWDRTGFSEGNYYHRRIDATIMEHLTSSPYVMSIRGFCSMTVLTPKATEGGDLYGLINSVRNGGEDLSSLDKLRVVIQLAEGVASMHEAGVAHNDLDASQRLFVGGQYRLNDFTYGFLIPKHPKTNEPCKSTERDAVLDPWKYKSPEYLAWCYPEMHHVPIRMDMSEVYSLGAEIYHLLTSSLMWEGELDKEKCKKLIFMGSRPKIPERIAQNPDAATQSIIKALEACWRHRPEDRPSAKQIVQLLRRDLFKITNGTEGGEGSLVSVKLPPLKEARENEEVCYYRFMTLPGRNDRGSGCDDSWFDSFNIGTRRSIH